VVIDSLVLVKVEEAKLIHLLLMDLANQMGGRAGRIRLHLSLLVARR
jgi:hypothetical protein